MKLTIICFVIISNALAINCNENINYIYLNSSFTGEFDGEEEANEIFRKKNEFVDNSSENVHLTKGDVDNYHTAIPFSNFYAYDRILDQTLRQKGYSEAQIAKAKEYFRSFLIEINRSNLAIELLSPDVGDLIPGGVKKIFKRFKFFETKNGKDFLDTVEEVDEVSVLTELFVDILSVGADVVDQTLNPTRLDDSQKKVISSILESLDRNSSPIFLTHYDSVVIANEVIRDLQKNSPDSQAALCSGILAAGNILDKDQLTFKEIDRLTRFKLIDYESDKVKSRMKTVFKSLSFLSDYKNLNNQPFFTAFSTYHLDTITYKDVTTTQSEQENIFISPNINYFQGLSRLLRDINEPRLDQAPRTCPG